MLLLLRRANLNGSLRILRPQSAAALTRISVTTQRSLKTNSNLNSSTKDLQDQQTRSNQASENFLKQMPERLVSEGDGLKPTTSANQFDTLRLHQRLNLQGYTPQQSEAIITLMLELLDEFFYRDYNRIYLNDMELENQSHLFHAAETELKYAIQNSRDTQLNNQHLQLMKLIRDLESLHDEMNEMTINFLQKDSKVDFHNHKIENTLLQRQVKMELSDCDNKISTQILGNTRSDIENLRWQTTRSGLLAVLILVFFMVGGASISKRLSVEHDKPVQVTLHTVDPEERDADEDDNTFDQIILDEDEVNPDGKK
ncbi:hypothetical protein ZYGM_004152 [Zygosaccharomyces mellis]|uniref:Uncharacterized protein n=1 Tax=Zygosaccharomyces mellis TaxID=42258 RepID=A0A4C2E162_9SACH|nr:hypothetical protein ZYGM_004152 [Zygosaccharomyces mellis]